MDVTSIDVDDQNQLQFSLWISFAEIYNEYIYDLLEPISMSKDGKRTVLRFGNDRKGNLYIKGITTFKQTSPYQYSTEKLKIAFSCTLVLDCDCSRICNLFIP